MDDLILYEGDVLELERHPVYDTPGHVPAYQVTERVVDEVRFLAAQDRCLLRLKGGGGKRRLWLSLSGSRGRGYWLTHAKRPALRYQILTVNGADPEDAEDIPDAPMAGRF